MKIDVLIVLGLRQGIVGVSKNPVFCVILDLWFFDDSRFDKLLMFLRDVILSGGPPFSSIFSMDSFFKPIGNECA